MIRLNMRIFELLTSIERSISLKLDRMWDFDERLDLSDFNDLLLD
jgi:hypothetical protein